MLAIIIGFKTIRLLSELKYTNDFWNTKNSFDYVVVNNTS